MIRRFAVPRFFAAGHAPQPESLRPYGTHIDFTMVHAIKEKTRLVFERSPDMTEAIGTQARASLMGGIIREGL